MIFAACNHVPKCYTRNRHTRIFIMCSPMVLQTLSVFVQNVLLS